MPAANQLELHPRYASPSLRKYAEERGIHLTAYGTGNSVLIEKDTNATVKEGIYFEGFFRYSSLIMFQVMNNDCASHR